MSVLQQSFGDFEVIVVDDGSTDNTQTVIEQISSGKLRYFKKLNQERGAARNYGIEHANGKYVVFMDSDDRMMPNHLEVLRTHLNHREENFIATKYTIFNEKTQRVPKELQKLSAGYYTYETFLIGNPLACCVTMRRENPELVKFREELKYAIMEDWIFLMQNTRFSKLYLIDEVTIGMRDHENRSMRGTANKIIDARKNALAYLLESIQFSERERKMLVGHSHYFCAVHAYMGANTRQGFSFLLRSLTQVGISVNACLLLVKLTLQMLWVRKRKKGF
jgi:glycosyltransferase involved in cell wall biosynthesis